MFTEEKKIFAERQDEWKRDHPGRFVVKTFLRPNMD